MTARRRTVDPYATRGFVLESVGRLAERRNDLAAETRQMLLEAYSTGIVSWTDLGHALGTSGSVAWHLAHPSGTAEEAQHADA